LFLKRGNDEFYIEIKTAKPNIDVFNKSKQKLLEWVALRKKKVTTILAIPYNPYHPEPYTRFTLQGVLDEEKELYVADKFWDFLGGKNTYTSRKAHSFWNENSCEKHLNQIAIVPYQS